MFGIASRPRQPSPWQRTRLRAGVCVLAVMVGLFASGMLSTPRPLAAQTGGNRPNAPTVKPAPRPGATAPKPAPAATPPAATPSPTSQGAREEILAREDWQRTIQQFTEWLSVQSIFPADEVRTIRLRLEAGIGRMTAPQLEQFLIDLQDKLAILTSSRAQDAQAYLEEKMAVASDAYARRIRQQLPDVLSSTPAQIDQALARFAARRTTRSDLQQSFEQSRQQRLSANATQLAARRAQAERAANRTSAAVTAASTPNDFTPARDYFPEQNNNNGVFMLPYLGGGFF